MVTQCDWSWYLDVGSSLITCYNKSTRTVVYQYDSAHCIQQRRHITHTDWLCIVGRDYNKNQNFCGDESIFREIGSTSRNRVNTKTKSHEIGSAQKRNLMKSGRARVYLVNSGQHREIGSTQKRNLMKYGQHKTKSHEIMSIRDFRFIIQYVNAYVNLDL